MGPSVWSVHCPFFDLGFFLSLMMNIRNLSGLALRQCIELGYHRNIKQINSRISILRLELRKRVFWCAYQMDCASSVNLGLPLSLPIQKVNTEVSIRRKA